MSVTDLVCSPPSLRSQRSPAARRPAAGAAPRLAPRSGRRVLVPFSGRLDPIVLDAAIRVARAEEATLVPAYLVVVPLEYELESALRRAGGDCDAVTGSRRAGRARRRSSGRRADREGAVTGTRPPASLGRRAIRPNHRAGCCGGHPGFGAKDLIWLLEQRACGDARAQAVRRGDGVGAGPAGRWTASAGPRGQAAP